MGAIFETYGSSLVKAIGVHLIYVVVAVAIGFVIGTLGGILLSRKPQLSTFVMPVLSVFQTIPGLAFIGILFLLIGMTPATVIIALAVYAVFPVLKNTYAGLLGVEPKYIEAAKGCGMTEMQALWQVELPLASARSRLRYWR